MKLKKSVKRDLPFVRGACEKILERFPNAPLRLYWWEVSEAFVIVTKDWELFDLQEYKELRHKLYRELLQKAGNQVDFIGFSLQDDDSYDPNCIEFEIPSLAKSRQRKVAAVR